MSIGNKKNINSSKTKKKTNSITKYRIKIGIYLLPNLITIIGLFCGFYSIILATAGNFISASALIFIAMTFDVLDGRVARMTNTTSTFGTELDSLSDMVSFCFAPAFLVYMYLLQDLGSFGIFFTFIYIAGGALRLARFNAQLLVVDKKYFQGLPSPAGAAVLAGFVWVANDMQTYISGYAFSDITLKIFAAVITVGIGALMVSNIRYFSFKEIDNNSRVRFLNLLLIVFVVTIVIIHPSLMLWLFFLIYALSGLLVTNIEIYKKRYKKLKKTNKY